MRKLVFLLPMVLVVANACSTDRAAPNAKGIQNTVDAPFEYEIVSTDETPHTVGPQVVLTLETTNEVAKQTAEDDLRTFWKHIAPTLGDRRVFVYLKTNVPGVEPWGVISRVNFGNGWEIDIDKNEFGVNAEPYHFVERIDRSVQNQRGMVVTLPAVNRIIEQLKRSGWTVSTRTEDMIITEKRERVGGYDMTITPESISLTAFAVDDLQFTDTAVLVFDEVGIGDKLKSKLQTVIGSPAYLRADKSARWQWTIGEVYIDYSHTGRMDNLYVSYAQ